MEVKRECRFCNELIPGERQGRKFFAADTGGLTLKSSCNRGT